MDQDTPPSPDKGSLAGSPESSGLGKFWQELRRRHVVRVAAVYAIVGWLVIYILEGSMQRSGNQFRLTAQLIDARNDEHLWAKNFTGELTEIFSVQSQLAKDVAQGLQAILSPQEEQQLDRPKSASIEAYELYFQAQEASGNERYELLDRAVALDPTFTDAWLYMAKRFGFSYVQGIERTPERERKAKHAIDMAVRLEPNNPDVLVGLGYYHFEFHLNFARARFYVEKIAERLPQHHDAQRLLGTINKREGRWSETISHFTRAQLLNPTWPDNFSAVADAYQYHRAWEKQAELYEIIVRKWPDVSSIKYMSMRGDFFANGPRIDLLRDFEEKSSSNYYSLLFLTGNLQAFKEEGIIDTWEKEDYRGSFSGYYPHLRTWQQAIVLKLLGEPEKANEILEYILNTAEIREKDSVEDFRGQMNRRTLSGAFASPWNEPSPWLGWVKKTKLLPSSSDSLKSPTSIQIITG